VVELRPRHRQVRLPDLFTDDTCQHGLTEAQQNDFNLLMIKMYDAHAEFASKVYAYSTVNGNALREQVFTP